MGALISALAMLFFAYSAYKQSKRDGSWSWRHFFTLIALVAMMLFCFILPVVNSKTLQSNPALLMTVMFSGIFLFVAGIIVLARRWGQQMSREIQQQIASRTNVRTVTRSTQS
jgi:uncharacterized membrane-anchored protein